MSVDERRDTFHCNHVSPRDLNERLLAQAYRPDVVAAVRTLLEKGAEPLSNALEGRLSQGRTPEYGDYGELCLKTRNVVGGLVDGSHVDRVSTRFAEKNGGSRITNETVLMNRSGAGSIGRVSVYLGSEPAFTNEELFRFRLAAPHDAAFVAVFFGTSLGQRVLERGVNGSTGQLKPVQEHVERVPVLLPHSTAQRYIGDKVRQAERLREHARRLEAESSAFFQLPDWTEPRAGARRAYTARRSAILSERLDAPFYDPGHEDLDALLRRRGDLALSEVAAPVEARWTRGGDKFRYFEIGGLDIASGVLTPTTTEVAAAPSRAQVRIEPWDVLVSTVRPNRRNVGLVLPPNGSLCLVASTGFAVLRFSTAESAAFYHSFLRSDAATQQLMRWNSGATYPAIESNVPLRVRAPRFESDIVQREGRRWLQKFIALSVSRSLTSAATVLVERLIEREVTEASLVAAQKALEAGDRGPDRAILQALREDGNRAQPLIPDLDGLYTLLDELDGEANA